MLLLEETGGTHTGAQPDFDGTGGFLWVRDGNGGNAFTIDGNYGAGGDALITMGGVSTSVFAMGSTGNDAVRLPSSSLSASEILDEPGLATISANGTSSYSVESSYAAVTSRTITAPVDGYLVVLASCEIDLRHEAPGASFVTAGVSLSPTSLPSNQDHSIYLSSQTPSAVFNVTAGSHTVYLIANRSGTTASYIWDAQLTVLFIPTAYGTVTPTSGIQVLAQEDIDAVSPALTSADIADEQRTSIQANEERMARELEALRAEVQAIKQAMSDANGNPDLFER